MLVELGQLKCGLWDVSHSLYRDWFNKVTKIIKCLWRSVACNNCVCKCLKAHKSINKRRVQIKETLSFEMTKSES